MMRTLITLPVPPRPQERLLALHRRLPTGTGTGIAHTHPPLLPALNPGRTTKAAALRVRRFAGS